MKTLSDVKEELASKFMMDLVKLPINFEQNANSNKLSNISATYLDSDKFDKQNCKLRTTPSKQKLNYTDNAVVLSAGKIYWKAVGSIIYLSANTRHFRVSPTC